jgi:hypothetical protein
MNEQLTSPVGYKHLQRIFGPDSTSEELTIPPAYGSSRITNRELQWCYVISAHKYDRISREKIPASPRGFRHAEQLDIEKTLCDSLGLHLCADLPPVAFDQLLDGDDPTTAREGPYRFIIPAECAESQEGIAALSKLNIDDFLFSPILERHEFYSNIIRGASRGIRWELARYPEYSVFQTKTTLKRNPGELELGILSLLRVNLEEYTLPPVPGVARIPVRALVDGDLGGLMENVLPKPRKHGTSLLVE